MSWYTTKMQRPRVKRKFVFIDESGDAGFPGMSDYFQINVLIADSNSLPSIEREMILYKYFLDHYGELKKKVNVK